MATIFCAIAGNAVVSLHATIPNKGAWVVDAEVGENVKVSGRVEVTIGSLKLSGTVDPLHSGTFGQTTKVRVVAGGGGWGKTLKPKAYHNDGRIKAKTIAEDAARESGETLGSFVPAAERVGIDYVRSSTATAATVLENVIGAVSWWVDFDGKTNVGLCPTTKPKAYDLAAFDPLTHVATIHADDPAALSVGSIIEDSRLGTPQVVRQIELTVEGEEFRILAWCVDKGSTESVGTVHGRLAQTLSAIAQKATGGKLFGLYRYRVVTMASDGRVNLQAVRQAAGLPDLLPITMRPGVAGVWCDLTPGSEVIVQFVEGDPTMPMVTGFSGFLDDPSVAKQIKIETSGQASAYFAADGRASILTTEDNTYAGRPVFFTVAPEGFDWVSPYGRMLLDMSGFHVKEHGGARIEVGSLSMPSPMDTMSSYVTLQAATVNLRASLVCLGADALPKDAIALSTPIVAFVTALTGYLEALVTATSAGIAGAGPTGGTAATAFNTAMNTALTPLTAAATFLAANTPSKATSSC